MLDFCQVVLLSLLRLLHGFCFLVCLYSGLYRRFSNIKTTLDSWGKPLLVMMYYRLCIVVFDLLKFLHLFSWGTLICIFLFFNVWFFYQMNAGLVEGVGKYSLIFNFLEEFVYRLGIIFSLTFGRINCEAIWGFLCGKVFT